MNAEATILGRDLVELRAAFAGNLRTLSECAPRIPSRGQDRLELAAPPSQKPWSDILFVNRGVRPIQAAEAEVELARVHAAEAGRLLREAAMLRGLTSATDCTFLDTSLEPRAPRESLHDALARWRRRTRAEAALWRIDGFESPAVLRACLARPISRWDTPRELAQAAFAIDPCDAGRLCLAYAEMFAGAWVFAALALEALLERNPERDLCHAAVRALALADRFAKAARSSGWTEVTEL